LGTIVKCAGKYLMTTIYHGCDSFGTSGCGNYEIYRQIRKLAGGLNIYHILKVIKNTTIVAQRVDELERLAFKIRPRELRKGSTDRIYEAFAEK